MRRDVIDEKGNPAFLFSNKVTDGANPDPPIGVQNTYVMQANQYAFGAYNLQVLVWTTCNNQDYDYNTCNCNHCSIFITQGDGVKFYLEPKPTDDTKIAIFTYLNEEQIEANKYYLQFNDEASTIVAMTSSQLGSEASLYIFQWRTAWTHKLVESIPQDYSWRDCKLTIIL